VIDETIGVVELASVVSAQGVLVDEAVPITETIPDNVMWHVLENVPLLEGFTAGSLNIAPEGTTLVVRFTRSLQIDRVNEPPSFLLSPVGSGFPMTVLRAVPLLDVVGQGTAAILLGVSGTTTLVQLDGSVPPSVLKDYFWVDSPHNQQVLARIIEVDSLNQRVRIDRVLYLGDPDNGNIHWEFRQVMGATLTTTKPTNGREYLLEVRGLLYKDGYSAHTVQTFLATAPRPRVIGAEVMPQGQILVTFGEPMLSDSGFVDPHEYSVQGPVPVEILAARSVADNQILLSTRGMRDEYFKVVVSSG
jgi:hypothetical protein